MGTNTKCSACNCRGAQEEEEVVVKSLSESAHPKSNYASKLSAKSDKVQNLMARYYQSNANQETRPI